MNALRETQILMPCLQYLTTVRGWLCWRNNNTGIKRTQNGREFWTKVPGAGKGISDILGIIPCKLEPFVLTHDCTEGIEVEAKPMLVGRFFACETKMPGEKPSDDQKAFIANVNRNGGLGIVVHSVDELIQRLECEGL